MPYKVNANSPLQIELSLHSATINEHTPSCDHQMTSEGKVCNLDASPVIPPTNTSCIKRCHTTPASHIELPPELIEQIFRSLIPYSPLVRLLDPKNDPRLRITQICQSWRAVAFSIPPLWNIYVDKVPTFGVVNLIASWLRQCSGAQLMLHGAEDLDPHDEDWKVKEYMSEEIIIPFANRIKELYMFPYHRHHLTSLPMIHLTTLSIDCGKPNSPVKNVIAPSLRCVHLRNICPADHICIFDTAPELPWNQLAALSLDGYLSMNILYDLLLECTSLEYLRVRDLEYDFLDDTPRGIFDLPYLKELHIGFSACVSFKRLFLFKVPRLTSLSIAHALSAPRFRGGFPIFIKHIQKPLRRLEITKIWGFNPAIPIEAILKSVPSVEHFSAKEEPLPPSILAKLGTGELLPNVEVLHLRIGGRETWESMLSTIVPNKPERGLLRLRDIYLYISQPPIYDPPEVQDLRNQGIIVHLVHPTCKYHITCRDPDCGKEVTTWLFSIGELGNQLPIREKYQQ